MKNLKKNMKNLNYLKERGKGESKVEKLEEKKKGGGNVIILKKFKDKM